MPADVASQCRVHSDIIEQLTRQEAKHADNKLPVVCVVNPTAVYLLRL